MRKQVEFHHRNFNPPSVHFGLQNYSPTDAVLNRGLAIFFRRGKIFWQSGETVLSQVGRLKYNSF